MVPPATRGRLFSGLRCPEGVYCEAFAENGRPREHWRAIIAAMSKASPELLRQRQERIKRMRHEDGAAYNPFDAPDGRGVPWALEMAPLPLTATEWSGLERGLIQRARLLEQVLADVYGPQELLKSGRLPPELIYANPHFLHACYGIRPSGGRFLTIYAVDCCRDGEGRFRVVREYGGSPMGLGYALENRIVISRLFPELYRRTLIRRLAPFFQALHTSLTERSTLRREDPNIVLLSPGPDSPIYFEQALLSRYLGYPLVEGQDLTVRNGRLFLKKLAGLDPVDAIFRHVDDGLSDPFALRSPAAVGVAGLIQVAREQNINLANPVGAGFIETPVLAVFLDELCNRLLGEPLQLPSHPAWWCKDMPGYMQTQAEQGVVRLLPALDRGLGGDLRALLEHAPFQVMAREPLTPSAAPVWDQDTVSLRPTVLRLFVCAAEEGFTVMPGGLAMTAPDVDTLTAGAPERQLSKDIWVLSDEPVEHFSLLSSLHNVSEFRRSSDLPSRVADHLLWLGRYMERAEGQIRLLRAVFRRLASEARPEDIPELAFLLDLARAVGTLAVGGSQKNDEDGVQERLGVRLQEALFCADRPESVAAVLKRVQEAARNVRDRLSRDSWRVINRLEDFGDNPGGDPLDALDNTLFTLSAFSGLAMESMTRGLGWRFMDMGRRIERALHMIGLIRFALPQVCRASNDALEALLEVSDSIMTYRARYRTAFQLAPVLDLLLLDESNPKSLVFQLSRLAAHVEELPRQSERRYAGAEERMTLAMVTAARLLDLTALACSSGSPENDGPLARFLESMEEQLLQFAQQLNAHYLTRVTATPHFSVLQGGGG
jgi:uncharacterized circularly permuted ATP-grasp superfamily protein/uncharacterized alpha-E superfamily protein